MVRRGRGCGIFWKLWHNNLRHTRAVAPWKGQEGCDGHTERGGMQGNDCASEGAL